MGALASRQRTQITQLTLRITPGTAQILPGPLTDVWHYVAQPAKGSQNVIFTIPNSYLGPLIKLKKGQVMNVTVKNELPEDTVVHWHGLHVPEDVDGHPSQSVLPGGSYRNTFKVINRAGTYWFHPHPDMMTGGQVYMGLAGLLLVSDDEEQALALPRGQFDVPVVIQDRVFDAVSNQFVYAPNGFVGTLGGTILVNGQKNYVHHVPTRAHRLRFLNGSNARIYKLAWSDSAPMILIGTDGGLLQAPVTKDYLTISPGERVEVWRQFSGADGTEIKLQSLAFSGAGSGGGGGLAQGAPFDVMTFRIAGQQTETLTPPSYLSNPAFENPANATNAGNPRVFPISMVDGAYVLNGEPFYMNQIADNEEVKFGDLELWEISNTASGTLVAHPIHLHGGPFQVISRTVEPSRLANWQTVSGGYSDEGWKDTMLIMPGETVRILIRFKEYRGVFLYHCHNLEHHDMGMMRNFRVN